VRADRVVDPMQVPIRGGGWLSTKLQEPVVTRHRTTMKRRYFRADAAFASPEVYLCLEAEGYGWPGWRFLAACFAESWP
jgi:hypothetical protein